MSLSNYPPGMPGPQRVEVELMCVNPSCIGVGRCVTAAGIRDLGTVDLVNDDDGYCYECGWELIDYGEKGIHSIDARTSLAQPGRVDALAIVNTTDDFEHPVLEALLPREVMRAMMRGEQSAIAVFTEAIRERAKA